jgi:hypothetical protein
MSARYVPYPDGIHKTWFERAKVKRERSGSPAEAPQTKKVQEMTPAEPIHGRRQVLKAELNWRSHKHTIRCHGTFLLDTACTGPILSADSGKKEKIPVERMKSTIQLIEAQGDLMMGAGEYFTATLEMVLVKHEECLRWEVGPLEKGISGYLPVSCVPKHNPDINWHTKRIQFRCEHYKKHCIPNEGMEEAIAEWEMLAGVRSQVYQIGTAVWHDEHSGVAALRLMPQYREWADV